MAVDAENPYESPQAEAGVVNPLTGKVLTENMVFYLKGAAPWLRFIGIVGFIGIGFSVIFMLVFAFGIGNMFSRVPGMDSFGMIGSGLVFLYLPFLAIYFFPVLFLYRFGNFIKSYLYTNDSRDLEFALKNNKSLWKFLGILMIIGLSFMALIVLGGIIAAIGLINR